MGQKQEIASAMPRNDGGRMLLFAYGEVVFRIYMSAVRVSISDFDGEVSRVWELGVVS